jgi:hypothetical protein
MKKSRKIEQGIFVFIALFGMAIFLFMVIGAYRTWRATGINVLQGDYMRLVQVAGLTVLFSVAYWASRIKERQERQATTNEPS